LSARHASPPPWLLVLASLAACTASAPSGLPDYAKPDARALGSGDYEIAHPIPYRALTRADFRATSPPAAIAQHASMMGAYTCAAVIPEEKPRLGVVYDAGTRRYVARVERMGVNGLMDPDCSWWNPNPTGLPADYILEHEQIHFALVEIEARKLAAMLDGMDARGGDASAAAQELQRKVQLAIDTATAVIVRRNTDFDRETSGRYQPEAQARWLARAQAELARLP